MTILGRAVRSWNPSAWGWWGWDGLDPRNPVPPRRGFGSWAGVPVNEWTMFNVQAVWSAISLISDTGSMLPAAAFRDDGDARVKMKAQPRLLQQPHPEMDLVEWLGRNYVSMLVKGNGYNRVELRDGLGFPLALRPLHPNRVHKQRNRESGVPEYIIDGDKKSPVPNEDILHIKGMTWPGAENLVGLAPLEFARQTIGLALAMLEFGSRWFGEGTHPSGVLKTDQKLQRDDAEAYRADWMEHHGDRNRGPAVLGQGLDWKGLSITPEESQFLLSRAFSRTEMAGWYRVPGFMIGDSSSPSAWGSGIEELGLQFVTYTMGIWLVRFERALSSCLPQPQYVKFNVSGLLRGRTLDRYKAYLLGRQAGWLCADDIRSWEEMAPVPDGQGKQFVVLPPGTATPAEPGAQEPGSDSADGGFDESRMRELVAEEISRAEEFREDRIRDHVLEIVRNERRRAA